MNNILEVEFTSIDIDGSSVGKVGDKTIKSYGVIVGEKAKVKIIKKKSNFFWAIPIEIVKSSEFRIKPKEDHFLSCSPYQILPYNQQIEIKKTIMKKLFNQDIEIIESPIKENYRTKIEFSFFIEQEKIYLAFFKRLSNKAKYKLTDGCILASDEMNKKALKIIENIQNINHKKFKGLMLRESKYSKEIISTIFVNSDLNEEEIAKIKENLDNIEVFYSDPKTPALTFQREILKLGKNTLTEKILNLYFQYSSQCFFQNNIPLFEKVINDITKYIDGEEILDLYSGVGSIGLSLSKYSKKIIGVEINQESSKFALVNAQINNIKNYQLINIPAEKLEKIEKDQTLVIDPPRTGIHPKLIKQINQLKPQKIIYLSCNPITQYNDYLLLKENYNIISIKAYDFYPLTPHIESLLVLKRIN